jgi:hypothetical protein
VNPAGAVRIGKGGDRQPSGFRKTAFLPLKALFSNTKIAGTFSDPAQDSNKDTTGPPPIA